MDDPAYFGPVKTCCPKCRSRDLTVCEMTEASMLFEVRGGVMRRLTHTEEFDRILGVNATCSRCTHHWKPRGAIQVTDLLEDQS